MARRRQRRRREKQLRHAPTSATPPAPADGDVNEPVERLVYSREQAAQALGVSLATLDRHVVPAIAIPGIVYKVEYAALPALCARHLPGLEALLRSANGAVRPS